MALLCALLLLPAAARAQRLTADVELQGFEPSSDFELMVGGTAVDKADLYFSQRAAAYLIMKAFDAPILIRQRSSTVESVHIMRVSRQDNGSIDLLQGAVLATLGRFRIDGEKIAFEVDGKSAMLVPRPPLVGLHGSADLLEHSPEYGVKGASYEPLPASLEALRAQKKDVRVQIFFGSWCSVCKRYLPLGLKLDKTLDSQRIQFQYYGLPKPPQAWSDPEVKRMNITGVPTAVVFVNGKEAGRISGAGWARPEQTLAQIVNDAG
jgi:thiol-disulfide isomerase/thioredoxin